MGIFLFCVSGVSCNLQITLRCCMGSTGQFGEANYSFLGSDFVSILPLFLSSTQTAATSFSLQTLRCHLPQLSLVSVLFKGSFFLSKLLFMDFCLCSGIITNNTVNNNHLLFGVGADAED